MISGIGTWAVGSKGIWTAQGDEDNEVFATRIKDRSCLWPITKWSQEIGVFDRPPTALRQSGY